MVEIRAADRPVPPPSIKTPVLQLASGGLVSKMEALDQSELHTVNKWGGALHYAVSNDHAAAARWLLERGVAVDGRTCNGHTALHSLPMQPPMRAMRLGSTSVLCGRKQPLPGRSQRHEPPADLQPCDGFCDGTLS